MDRPLRDWRRRPRRTDRRQIQARQGLPRQHPLRKELAMTRKDLDKLLDHMGVQPEDFVGAFLAADAKNLGEIEPGDSFRLEPVIHRLTSDYFVIQMRQK